MAQEIVNKAPALPASMISKIAEGIGRSSVGAGSLLHGHTLLRMDKGDWFFGQAADPVQQGSQWIVNIASFKHGYVAWHESKIVDEQMVEVWHDAPIMPVARHPTGAEYRQQASVELKCLTGEDAGQEVMFKISSMGGTEALSNLFRGEIKGRIDRMGADYPFVYPVITLSATSYANKRYGGQTWKPIFDVIAWADINGELEDDTPLAAAGNGHDKLPPDKPVVAAEPAKPAKPVKPSLHEPQPAAPAAAATGQRRRPGR